MKRTLHSTFLPFLLISIACNNLKNQAAETRLQHAWQFDSGEIFYDRSLTAPTGRVAMLPHGATYDFRKNNLLYRYIPSKHDTSGFKLLPGDSILLTYEYINGELWEEADTTLIRTVTDEKLVLVHSTNIDSTEQWIALTFTRK